ncbi:hypothetical protein MMC09_005701 [Bachmanniomyces sp. S44760]|nr:hypothetical protein [Bachmanniomyces sp. S44760]
MPYSRHVPTLLRLYRNQPCRNTPQKQNTFFSPSRSLAQVRSDHDHFPIEDVLASSPPSHASPPPPPPVLNAGEDPSPLNRSDVKPPSERTIKLGKTLRILQTQLPTLLASPLPQEILSPRITLHLFPSTHPHLPTVSGRVAYHAALWTAPMAWGRMPIVGNVRLKILSERVVKTGPYCSSSSSSTGNERLIVRWETEGRGTRGLGLYRTGNGNSNSTSPIGGISSSSQVDKITEWLRGRDASANTNASDDKAFTGLFIFAFDEQGRIETHTIEHAEQGGNWEVGRWGGRVVSVTDWLLGLARGNGNGNGRGTPALQAGGVCLESGLTEGFGSRSELGRKEKV